MMKQPRLKTVEWDGQPIDRPGMYSKLSLTRYHSPGLCIGPSVSSGGLRRIAGMSPAHFFCTWTENPERIERPDTKALIFGRAAHMLFLGELFFSRLFCVQPEEYINDQGEVKEWTYRANNCKQWRDDRKREGRAILTAEDFRNLLGMADSLGKHPIIHGTNGGDGALNGMIERSLVWQDKATGLWCKARPDAIPTDSGDFVDLKTTTSVMWLDMQRSIAEFGYHQQAAFVRMAAREVLGFDHITFTLVFVEREAPFCVRIVSLKDIDLDRGEKQNRAALDTIARCIDSGVWPGPGGIHEDAAPIELPEWAQQRIDDRLEHGLS
jgi:hypothetical protein